MKQNEAYRDKRTKLSAGFSLTEMLVTVLLMSLATLAIAAGITAAVRTYREMTLKADAQTLLGTAIAAIDDDFASADLSTLSLGSSGSNGSGASEVSFFSGNRGYSVHIHNDADTIYVTDAVAETDGTSGSSGSSGTTAADKAGANGAIPLVTTRTRTLNLRLQISDISITPAPSKDTSGKDDSQTLQNVNPYFTYTITVYKDQKKIESETVRTAVIGGY
ncbi:MAG: type II secretion system protein J [Bilifractor sp.]